jgi:GT2 family glycosyltransferase
MPKPSIAVIVVTHNRKDDLARCLESVAQQQYESLETIVVDNGSTDGTAGFVRESYPGCTLCVSGKNAGTSVTRNAGIKLSSSEYIWFLDSDAYIADPGLGQALVSLFDRNPDIGAVGGEAVVDTNNQIIGVKRQILERNGMLRGDFLLDLKPLEFRSVECLPTCNLFIRRDVLQKVGGLTLFFSSSWRTRISRTAYTKRGISWVFSGECPSFIISRNAPVPGIFSSHGGTAIFLF